MSHTDCLVAIYVNLDFTFFLNFVLGAISAISHVGFIETVSPEGTFCDTVQIPSSVGDMELI